MTPAEQARSLAEQGIAAVRAGANQRGLELFDRAIATNPGDPMLPNRIGGFLMSTGQMELAANLLTATSQRFPNHAGTLSNLGTILVNLGRHEAAAESWNKALALDPNMHSARFN